MCARSVTFGILGAKVTLSKSIVPTARDQPVAPFLPRNKCATLKMQLALPRNSHFCYEHFAAMRRSEGGDASGGATALNVVRGSYSRTFGTLV